MDGLHASCKTCYRTKYGMVVEMPTNGRLHYVKAEIPLIDRQDMTACVVVWANHSPHTPDDILDAIPEVRPFPCELWQSDSDLPHMCSRVRRCKHCRFANEI